jgi:hypothetical protein
MTDSEKCAFVYGFSRGMRIMAGMYETSDSPETAKKRAGLF